MDECFIEISFMKDYIKEPLAKVYLDRIANAGSTPLSSKLLRSYLKVWTNFLLDKGVDYPSQPIGHQYLLAHSHF